MVWAGVVSVILGFRFIYFNYTLVIVPVGAIIPIARSCKRSVVASKLYYSASAFFFIEICMPCTTIDVRTIDRILNSRNYYYSDYVVNFRQNTDSIETSMANYC